MAMDEEYLDNLLKNFEEEERARETQSRQEKKIITDIDENSVSEDSDAENYVLEDSDVENSASAVPDEEDWKTDLDELLAAAVEKLDESDDVFLQSEMDEILAGNVQTEGDLSVNMPLEDLLSEDVDVTQFIDGLEETDESLAEISELLKKSDNNESIDIFEEELSNAEELSGAGEENVLDDIFAEQGQEIQELIQETVPKKKKKVFPWKKKNKKSDKQDEGSVQDSEEDVFWQSIEGNEQSEQDNSESKNANIFSNLWNTLVQEEESDGESEENSGNGKVLNGADGEKEGKKKKEKKKKEKKKGNGKKAGAETDDDAESSKKPAKEKKKRVKKEKKNKEKPKKTDTVIEKPTKLFSRKTLLLLTAFCASLIAAIMCLSTFLPDYIDKKQAREAFYQGNYEDAYVLLYGKKLNASDTLILNRVSIVLEMERNVEAYYFHLEEGREAKALNALFTGVHVYNEKTDKDEFGAGEELRAGYQKILDILSRQYAIDEEEALEIISLNDVRYSERIYAIAEGTEADEVNEGQETTDTPQDILPEEEDIIELNGGNEGA